MYFCKIIYKKLFNLKCLVASFFFFLSQNIKNILNCMFEKHLLKIRNQSHKLIDINRYIDRLIDIDNRYIINYNIKVFL